MGKLKAMLLLLTSFLAGILTVLAPCVLPLLPIIIGSSASRFKWEPLVVILSLSVSIILFTLLLRASTILIGVPSYIWSYVSGGILIVLGLVTLFPEAWDRLMVQVSNKSKQSLQKSAQKQGIIRPVLMGASLGPVFASCSPTYSLILATVLPASFMSGLFYLTVYTIGLAFVLGLIAWFGRSLTSKLQGISDSKSKFKKGLGLIFVLVGVAIIFKWDKAIEAALIDRGYYGITAIEEKLVKNIEDTQ